MIDDPAQGVTLANVDILSATGRRSVSAAEEPIVFMALSKVEAMLRREKRKAHVSSICLDPKPPYVSRLKLSYIKWDTSLDSFRSLMEEKKYEGACCSFPRFYGSSC